MIHILLPNTACTHSLCIHTEFTAPGHPNMGLQRCTSTNFSNQRCHTLPVCTSLNACVIIGLYERPYASLITLLPVGQILIGTCWYLWDCFEELFQPWCNGRMRKLTHIYRSVCIDYHLYAFFNAFYLRLQRWLADMRWRKRRWGREKSGVNMRWRSL